MKPQPRIVPSRRSACSTTILLASLIATLLPTTGPAAPSEQEKTAQDVATLFRAARKVVSDSQAVINDAEKGDKGLSGQIVVAKTKENYQAAAGKPVNETDLVMKMMLESVAAVMTDAQPLINEKGKGFKGFLPAVFARQMAELTSEKLQGKVFIKLTAPKDLLRNRANRPDEWETSVMEKQFRAAGWENGRSFGENGEHKGKPGFRLALPEYYGQSCLNCHGGPKGDRDITGGLKDGGKLNDLGGAISVVIYNN